MSGVERFDSVIAGPSHARKEPKAGYPRQEAVDAAARRDHARQVIEHNGIPRVAGAKHELSPVLRLRAKNRLARTANTARQ